MFADITYRYLLLYITLRSWLWTQPFSTWPSSILLVNRKAAIIITIIVKFIGYGCHNGWISSYLIKFWSFTGQFTTSKNAKYQLIYFIYLYLQDSPIWELCMACDKVFLLAKCIQHATNIGNESCLDS